MSWRDMMFYEAGRSEGGGSDGDAGCGCGCGSIFLAIWLGIVLLLALIRMWAAS